ncbi:hypothetical protein [uncultured Dubosiella sp.]|uniref:hypothetical protein n=1 Tax=uncultured Dubosiella sp. TaxID=1937011 RepID=UPI00272F5A6A|nr:hypothetical protein [uncultured Dubosiella sp.]
MELVAEYLANLGLDAVKQHADSKIDEHKLKCALKEYIEREKKYNSVCTMAEECDFQGLIEYISQELLDDVTQRVFSIKKNERREAHEKIISKAIAKSKASTEKSRGRVRSIIATCLEIIRNFFKDKISFPEYYLASEMIDEINENTIIAVNSASLALQGAIKESNLYSVEKMSQMVADEQTPQVEKQLTKLFAGMSVEHRLYPYYGYTYNGKNLKSIPLSVDAERKYPAKLNCKATIRVGDRYFDDTTMDPFVFAYRNQLKLVLSVSEAVKLLGDEPDPIQNEATQLIGKDIVINPPEFPKAFPCAIKVGEKTYFDYILLRTEKILDDGTYIINNREQVDSAPIIYFEVKMNPKNPKKVDFKINQTKANNRELLNYARFMDELIRAKDLHIYMLDAKKDFIAGIVDNVNYESGFPSIPEEIDFLQRVCAIENYFKVEMNTHRDIILEEYNNIVKISDLILNDEVESTWEEASFSGVVGEAMRKQFENIDSSIAMLSYIGECNVKLLDAEFKFKYMHILKCAVIQNLDKIKSRVSILDDGDPIRIKFVPGEDNRVIDTLHIPKELEDET